MPSLAEAAAPHVTEPVLRARLLTLQGQIAWNTRSLNDGYDLILQAAHVAAGADQTAARQLAMLAAALAAFGGRSGRRERGGPGAPQLQRAQPFRRVPDQPPVLLLPVRGQVRDRLAENVQHCGAVGRGQVFERRRCVRPRQHLVHPLQRSSLHVGG